MNGRKSSLVIEWVVRLAGWRLIEAWRAAVLTSSRLFTPLGFASGIRRSQKSESSFQAVLLNAFPAADSTELKRAVAGSQSQSGQDLFAFAASGGRRGGFFVEFGAGDGLFLSNTLLLERDYGWTGILAEPLPRFHQALRRNRLAVIDTGCVWSQTGETVVIVDEGYLSTVRITPEAGRRGSKRRRSSPTNVQTVALHDLLRRHDAPPFIDFMSIDTEGTELEILEAFPFGGRYSIGSIVCEHNFSPQRDSIRLLLEGHGYRRVAVEISGHDDWFVLEADANTVAST